jgi:hypothetical protein
MRKVNQQSNNKKWRTNIDCLNIQVEIMLIVDESIY